MLRDSVRYAAANNDTGCTTPNPAAACVETPRNLQLTPRIRRREDAGARLDNVLHLAREQQVRLLRLGNRVHPGRPAAPRRFRERYQRHTRNQREQRTRLMRNLLSVHQVTGVVVRDDRPSL